jgi:hypothetical protein
MAGDRLATEGATGLIRLSHRQASSKRATLPSMRAHVLRAGVAKKATPMSIGFLFRTEADPAARSNRVKIYGIASL